MAEIEAKDASTEEQKKPQRIVAGCLVTLSDYIMFMSLALYCALAVEQVHCERAHLSKFFIMAL